MIGTKVKIYYNLHKHVWSIMDYKTRKIIAHSSGLTITNAEFRVSEKGRQRVIKECRKNVHSFAIGILTSLDVPVNKMGEVAYYNPYKQDCFTVNGNRVDSADIVRFYPDRVVLVGK